MNYERNFFKVARDRFNIKRFRDDGQPFPWTNDPILKQYRFCNVFREDDKTTVWFKKNIRDILSGGPKVLMATIIFRWFNYIPTGVILLDLLLGKWSTKKAAQRLRKIKGKFTTGAFLVRSPHGINKIDGLLQCIDAAWKMEKQLLIGCGSTSLQEAHATLMDVPCLGRFMAYEVVTDLRHTQLLGHAHDINSWASAGPGCARGLGWVFRNDPKTFDYAKKSDEFEMVRLMQKLLKKSRSVSCWPLSWPDWEMREVEHWLCEYDKYRRGKNGQRLKRKFSCE